MRNTVSHTTFSESIDLKRLERESRRLLAAGFLVAVLFHAAIGVYLSARHHPLKPAARPEPVRIIRTDIIEIPRPSRAPLVISEHRFTPKPLRRPGFAVSIPGNIPSGRRPPELKLQPPEFRVDTESQIGRVSEQISDGVSLDAAVPRAPDTRIPLPLDAGDNPGMFRSDIIYRPSDKLATQGYVHIPLIRSGGFIQTETYSRSLRSLIEGINRHTNVRAILDNPYEEIQWHYGMRGVPTIAEAPSERGIPIRSLLKYHPPLLYILADREISFTPEEKEVMFRYLGSGGIVLVESARPGDHVLREHLRSLAQKLWSDAKRKVVPSLDRILSDHPCIMCSSTSPALPQGRIRISAR